MSGRSEVLLGATRRVEAEGTAFDHATHQTKEVRMRTLINVENANCTYCMNDVRDALLARPLVHDVRTDVVTGCWEVDHDQDDVVAITDLLRQSLHGWEVADNGEIIMIATSPDVSAGCAAHPRGPDHSR